ncbi:homeobox protein dve-1 [Anthonomus grandis grandis]|uniref:homeobox protein dve-1 n=1 Tax=Anthonomus grandis grandis TaxID=2921223 RepID=UPI0021656E7C|nr:homeobox protein dve-1 [Anthonomus grandis grandis]
MAMDFQSAMETFAEAWVAANIKGAPISEVATQGQALTRSSKTPPSLTATGRTSRDSAERNSTPQPVLSSTPLDNTISPQSIKEETSSGKSIPVHCIVEAISVLEDNRLQHGAWRRRPMVETDTYVIIPTGTSFHNLVQAALFRLGYSSESAAAAKGSVLIKNWKALNFDQISDDPLVTVGDILGELSTVATLRIQVFRGKPGSFNDIKDKLLRYLLLQSHGILLSSGCPLDEMVLTQICRSNLSTTSNFPEIPEETRRKFDLWWSAQFNTQIPSSRSQFIPTYPSQYSVPPQSTPPMDRNIPDAHPAMQTVHSQFPTQKTRMRTSFDPELELPKLQRWFTENQHPSRQQIQQYVKELNNLESRRGRKPLDINNVVYWFKNARAAQKRAEVRNINPNMHLSVNGFTSPSPTNGGLFMGDAYLSSERLSDPRLKNSLSRRGPQNSHTSDEFSNVGSDMEDDELPEEQSPCPSVPLSLTTNRKSDDRTASPKTITSPSPAPDIQIEKCKEEPIDEPVNYSSGDHINNNKVLYNDDHRENEDDSKSQYDTPSSPSRSISHRLSPDINGHLLRRNPEGLDQLPGFPMVPNTMFSHNIMYMSQYIPSLAHSVPSSCPGALNMSSLTVDERRKRNRTFIDPVTEVPRLEQWFSLNTHPSHNLIIKYTEELNCMAYRQKFPRLEPKNVQFWFKNRRAKCKRLKMSLYDSQSGQYHHADRD